MDDKREPTRLPLGKGDGCLVVALGSVVIVTFGFLAFEFHTDEAFSGRRDALMVFFIDLLLTIAAISVLSILVVLFRRQWLEKVLCRTLFKFVLMMALFLLALGFLLLFFR